MSVSLSIHGIEPSAHPTLREVFHAHARRLRGRLDRAAPDLVRLEGRIEKELERETICVALYLKLPGSVLTASGEGTGPTSVLSAFDELERRLDRHLARRSSTIAAHAPRRVSVGAASPRA